MSHRTLGQLARTLGAIAVIGILGGCVAEVPAPSPTPTIASPSATPTPSAVADPLDSVTSLVLRPTALELRDTAGAVVASLDYMGSATDAIATLTTVFGEPPVDEPYRGTNHTPPGTYHRWNDFVLDERFYDEGKRTAEGIDYLVWPRFAAYFDGPSALNVSLTSVQGLKAGDAWATVSADPAFNPSIYTCIGTPIEAVEITTSRDGVLRSTVVVVPTDDGSSVKWMGAPETEADGCA